MVVVVACLINLVGLGLILAGITGWPTLVQFFLFQSCMGFISGNAIALAQGRARGRAGAGSAVIGLVQFLFGGLVSPLTALAGEHSAVPMAVVMALCSTLAVVTALGAHRQRR
ncbi:hypothetical protein [Salinibacterium sp. ZJ454]|uniref:hypothetical protein n=1 Tax=Salinibacterium sp. ZJ454 TaxID=2708339 RepID=UPI001FBB7DA4|nr:hypothetical protein [Salinibacterium sp. ZJ454]